MFGMYSYFVLYIVFRCDLVCQVDVSEKESEALLSFLFAHITKPEFQVRWRWQPNDIAIWDNRVTQHYANADYLPQRRIMHRATILGDKPFYRAG